MGMKKGIRVEGKWNVNDCFVSCLVHFDIGKGMKNTFIENKFKK